MKKWTTLVSVLLIAAGVAYFSFGGSSGLSNGVTLNSQPSLGNDDGLQAKVKAFNDSVVTLADAVTASSTTLDGDAIADDTIDDDSIDFTDVTGADLTLTDCGAITASGTLTASGAVNLGTVIMGDVAAYTNVAASSGKVHFVPDLTADCTILITNLTAGMSYEFVYAGAAADAQDWIITTGNDDNYFVGGVVQIDPGATSGVHAVNYYSDGNSNSKLTVYTPEAGTCVRLWCSTGTYWHVSGTVVSDTDTGAAFADQ